MLPVRPYYLAIAIWIVLSILILVIVLVPGPAVQALSLLPSPGDFINKNIGTIVNIRGTSFAIDITISATQKRIISRNDCQSAMQTAGRAAYRKYGLDLPKLFANKKVDQCLDGYIEGLASEVMVGGGDVRQNMQKICSYTTQAELKGGDCLHGIGHAALERTGKLPEALSLCDSLDTDSKVNVSSCHKGVFNQLIQELTAIDQNKDVQGHTYPEVPSRNPYAFCDILPVQYKDSCYSQLAQRYVSDTPEKTIELCSRMASTQHAASICTRINTAVAAELAFDANDTSSITEIFDAAPEMYKRSALMGIHDAYLGATRLYPTTAPWADFCNTIAVDPYKNLCVPESEMATWQMP